MGSINVDSDWQIKVAKAQKELDQKIPSEWRIKPDILSKAGYNVLHVFETSPILSNLDREITTASDATFILEQIRNRIWSAEDVTRAFCKRAAMAQQLVGCLMDVDFNSAIRQARELDEHLRTTGKVVGPLHGLPISLKDLTAVKGMKYSMGYVSWADRVAHHDAPAVEVLRKAGAVTYVKTTMPQTGMALETVSHLWGRTLNPYNTRLSAGGSSGGEGALLGALGSPVGIGTDIGGSIRGPAAFNAIYGLKPSSQRVSYKGNMNSSTAFSPISSAMGPMGRSVRDLDLICKVLTDSEPWLKDATVIEKPWVSVETPEKVTIGVMLWDEIVMPHPPVQRALQLAVSRLRAAGHEVVEFKPYQHQRCWEIGHHLYYPTGGREIKKLLEDSGEPPIQAVHNALSSAKALDMDSMMHYQSERKAFKEEYLAHWNNTASLTTNNKPVDAILLPTLASASFPHDFYPWLGYLTPWNVLDYPGVVLPVTTANKDLDPKDSSYIPSNDRDKENWEMYDPELFDGAPVSLQLVGRALAEEKLLAVAEAVDRALRRGAGS